MKNYLLLLLSVVILISCSQKDNVNLSELAKQDQLDRKNQNPETSKNDFQRRKELKEIIKNDGLKTSSDFYNAGIILQHGENPEDYLKANEYANKAVELDSENREAKILVAQSKDRYLSSLNRPQIYGTQRITLGNLEYLNPIDTSIVSDEERKELGIMTLQERLNAFNKVHSKNEKTILAYVASDSLIRVFFPEKRADLIGSFDELLSKINYPEEAKKNNIEGKVLVEYIITPEGNIKNIVVADGLGYGCDEEAIRIISQAKFRNYLNRDIERRTRIPFENKQKIN